MTNQDNRSNDINDSKSKAVGRITRDFRFVWTIIGSLLLVAAVGYVLKSLSMAIYAVLFAGLLIFILRSPIAWLSRKGLGRTAATAIMILLTIGVLVAIVYSFIPMVVDQTSGFVESLPQYFAGIQEWWADFMARHQDLARNEFVQSIIGQMGGALQDLLLSITKSGALSGVVDLGVSVANAAIIALTALVIAFWILVDYDKVTHEIHIIAGPKSEWYLILFSTMTSKILGGFIKGTLIGALFDAVIMSVILMIVDMPFAIVLGLFAGLLTIIPYLGAIIAAIVLTLIGFFQSALCGIVALLASILVPWIVHTFISPKIMSSTVNLHPGLTMIAIIAGLAVGGAIGMVVGIPLFALARAIFIYFFESLTGRQLVTPDGAMFKGDAGNYFDPVADATAGALTGIGLTQMIEENEEKIYSSKVAEHSAAARRAKAHKEAQAENPISLEDLIAYKPEPSKSSRRSAVAEKAKKLYSKPADPAPEEAASDSSQADADEESNEQ